MRLWRAGLLLLLWAAWAVRVVGLGQQELRGDEAFGYLLARQDVAAIVAETLRLAEPHPVGSYLLAHGWLALAGESEFALRFPSAWSGLLAVALAWALARRLMGATAAWLGAAVVAASAYGIWHAQDARMYTESLALGLLAAWLLWQAVGRRRWAWWLGFGLAVAAALHVHYYNAFLMLVLDGAALVLAWRRRQTGRWLAAQALIAVLWLPWFVQVAATLTGYGGNGDSPGLLDAARRVAVAFSVGETAPAPWRALGAVAWLALAALGLAALPRRAALFLMLYLAVPVAAIWLASWQRPIFNERYLLLASPAAALLAGAAWAGGAWQRRVAAGLLAVLLLANLASLHAYRTDPARSKTIGWRALATALAAAAPDDRIVQNFPDPTLWYYYRGPTPHVVLPPAPNDARGTQTILSELAAVPRRLWFIPQRAPGWDADGHAAALLARHFERLAAAQHGVFPLLTYATPPLSRAGWTPVGAEFAGAVRLAGVSVDATGAQPGGTLGVTLFWQRSAPSPIAYTAFVHVIGPDGQMAGQADGPPGGQPLPVDAWAPDLWVVDARAIPLAPAAAPGDYHVAVGLYDPATLARAPVRADGWRVDDDRLFLPGFRVPSAAATPAP